MPARTKSKNSEAAAADKPDDELTDDEIERSIAKRGTEIRQKLSEAKKSIERGRIEPLESLPTLLRAARRAAKTAR